MNRSVVHLTVLSAGVLILLILTTACGIPSYPYLYPPEAFESGDRVGFTDNKNDPDKFISFGYEIYYRFYSGDPDPIGGSNNAVNDMNNYFNYPTDFISITSDDAGTNAYAYGFRRLLVDLDEDGEVDNTSNPPQLPFSNAQFGTGVEVEISIGSNDNIIISYLSDTYTVYRTAADNSANKGIYPLSNYDFDNDTDIVDSDIDIDNIY
ncbi:MAG: hypothetical protein ACOC7X_08920, partial [Spirochaetota bacterium]